MYDENSLANLLFGLDVCNSTSQGWVANTEENVYLTQACVKRIENEHRGKRQTVMELQRLKSSRPCAQKAVLRYKAIEDGCKTF